jgi:hypothetical protein
MEVCSIGFPILDVLKGNKLRQETLEAIADWEKRQATNESATTVRDNSIKSPSAYSSATTLKSAGDVSFSKQSFESHKSDMLTMTALENALRTNAIPLLQFAALKDFSGMSNSSPNVNRIYADISSYNRRKRQFPDTCHGLAALLVRTEIIHGRAPPPAVHRRHSYLRALHFSPILRVSH